MASKKGRKKPVTVAAEITEGFKMVQALSLLASEKTM
jgi:hypothetical protein